MSTAATIEISESIALDDSCQRKLYAHGHFDDEAFRAAVVAHIRESHEACCVPRIAELPIDRCYLRQVPLRGNIVTDSQHVIVTKPARGASPVTMLDAWLPLFSCKHTC